MSDALNDALKVSNTPSYSLDPDVHKTAPQLIESRGFTCETHSVTTPDDGEFSLTLHRIPHSNPRGVVLLQHGILDSSNTWINNFSNQSLAFLLATSGYDVWLGNVRANVYSSQSHRYSPTQDEYWKFSFDEHILYDIPSMINYILNTTSRSTIDAYISHSQGTTIGFGAFSHPKTKDMMHARVNRFIALAPVVYPKHLTAPLLLSLAKIHFDWWISLIGHGSFLPSTEFLEWIIPDICDHTPPPFKELCKSLLCVTAGCDVSCLNITRIPVYLSYFPAGTSKQNMAHWAQLVRKNAFQNDRQFLMYDFMSEQANMKHYGQITPPEYDLSNIHVPIAIFHGGKDTLSTMEDVKFLIDRLRNGIVKIEEYKEEYGHLDFVWGIDGKGATDVNQRVVTWLNNDL